MTCVFEWAGWACLRQSTKSNRHVFRTRKATDRALSSVVLHCADLLGERLAPEFALLPCPELPNGKRDMFFMGRTGGPAQISQIKSTRFSDQQGYQPSSVLCRVAQLCRIRES